MLFINLSGEAIYDKIRAPDSVTELTILEILGWNVNAVKRNLRSRCSPLSFAAGEFLSSTKEIGAIKLLRANFREKKEELEIAFEERKRFSLISDLTFRSSRRVTRRLKS